MVDDNISNLDFTNSETSDSHTSIDNANENSQEPSNKDNENIGEHASIDASVENSIDLSNEESISEDNTSNDASIDSSNEESIPEDNTSSHDNTSNDASIDVSDEIKEPIQNSNSIFSIENIQSITFYAYYGHGKGSLVPDENINEIKNWLNSFTIDEIAPDIVPPGTNNYYVEIIYSNGTAIKNGLDLITIDDTTYCLKCDEQPKCFAEIISKTSIE